MAVAVQVMFDKKGKRILSSMNEAITPRTLLKAVGEDQKLWIEQNFRQEGKEQKWPPLKPQTIKRRRLGSSKPLQDTGKLFQSFVKQQPIRKGQSRIVVGSNIEYAHFHDEGTEHIPQRRILPTKPVAQERADKVIVEILRKASRGTT